MEEVKVNSFEFDKDSESSKRSGKKSKFRVSKSKFYSEDRERNLDESAY